MKALDLNETSPYQASWQAPPEEDAMAKANEPADTSGISNAIQNLDPAQLHPDPQLGPQMIDSAMIAIDLMASNRDVHPTQGHALLKALEILFS